MGGRIATKPLPHAKYEKQLIKLEKQLDSESADVLGALAVEFHGVSYSLGHDIPAIISKPDIVDRATRGKVIANERAAQAYVRANDSQKALYHFFAALESWSPNDDLVRIGEQLASVLDTAKPAAATRLRAGLESLTDDKDSRNAFAAIVQQVKYAR